MVTGGGVRRGAATLNDVAALAGVSPSTVSRALNHPGRITAATTQRIKAAADELGFQFNTAARALLTGKTSTIGLVLADITNPVVFGVIRGAERAAAAAGCTLIIAESQQSGAKEADTARSLLPSVDGLVLSMSWLDEEAIRALAQEKPLVVVNREIEGISGAAPDVRPGVEALLDHLVDRGHERIAYVSGPTASWMNMKRWEAVFDGARHRGLKVFEVPSGEASVEGGRRVFTRVRVAPATAVVAYNDLLAIGMLQAAQSEGVRVPEQLAISGFDDIFGSTFTTPPLTTVASPLEEVAASAVAELTGIEADVKPLVTRLVIRGTT